MVDKIGIFNSVSVIVYLNVQLLWILRRQLGPANWKKIRKIVFQIYLGQINMSTCIFEDIFEEIWILNDTKLHLSHQNLTLRDHQTKVKNDNEDVSRQKIPGNNTQSKCASFL